MKKFVSVVYSENPFKSYVFATDIEDLKAGDLVVCDSSRGLGIATVEKYVDSPSDSILKIMKWVVQKIDMTKHNERLQKEEAMKALKTKMESRRKQLEEIQLFALLAKEDESMKSLFEEYMNLSKEV